MAVLDMLQLLLLMLPASASTEEQQHYWPQARGDVGRYGVTSIIGPHNLSASLAWRWRHPSQAILNGMALIDSEKNIYAAAMDGIYKFNIDGKIVWHYNSLDGVATVPFGPFYSLAVGSLEDDCLYVGGTGATVVKLKLHSGREVWKVKVGNGVEMDTPYVHSYRGVVMSAHTSMPDSLGTISGNRRVTALNASTGETLWDYTSDFVLWNFHPMYPGDDTFLTMDIHGGVFRMKLHNGERVWYTPPPEEFKSSFTDGGLILDDALGVYTCANLFGGGQNSPGALRKYRLEDGKMLWQQFLPQPCVSWPASDGKMVVVPVGALPSSTPPVYTSYRSPDSGEHVFVHARWLPGVFRSLAHKLSVMLGTSQSLLWGNWPSPMSVHAFNSADGSELWTYNKIPDWRYYSSRGDEEHWEARIKPWPFRPVCGPASWSAPTIGGDGTVYAGGMNGVLYAIRDANRDRAIDDSEVSTLDIGDATLHGGTSFAPGLMAFASCAELLVFRW